MCVRAFYMTRKGAGGVRPIKDAADAEKILRGGYNATTVRLEDGAGNKVGERFQMDGLDRGKWMWWFDPDAFIKDRQVG